MEYYAISTTDQSTKLTSLAEQQEHVLGVFIQEPEVAYHYVLDDVHDQTFNLDVIDLVIIGEFIRTGLIQNVNHIDKEDYLNDGNRYY